MSVRQTTVLDSWRLPSRICTAGRPQETSKRLTVKTALITGITGQDGSYLADFLLEKDYVVHGIIRPCSTFNTDRVEHIYEDPHTDDRRLVLHYGDVTDSASLRSVVSKIAGQSGLHEIYHLAAQSHVKISFDQPVYTANVVALSVLRLLEVLRDVFGSQTPKLYNAGSSEMFGGAFYGPINEDTPFCPRSPYAAAKVFAHHVCRQYRDAYGMFICNGILGNHESPRRKPTFVTRKVTRTAARIEYGLDNQLFLWNLDAKRDWGFALDYVAAMWLMLQQDEPDDFVVGTGVAHSVRELCDEAFSLLGKRWEDFVKCDERYRRPLDVEHLIMDASKAQQILDWKPKTSFSELVKLMLEHDLEQARFESANQGCRYERVQSECVG